MNNRERQADQNLSLLVSELPKVAHEFPSEICAGRSNLSCTENSARLRGGQGLYFFLPSLAYRVISISAGQYFLIFIRIRVLSSPYVPIVIWEYGSLYEFRRFWEQ